LESIEDLEARLGKLSVTGPSAFVRRNGRWLKAFSAGHTAEQQRILDEAMKLPALDIATVERAVERGAAIGPQHLLDTVKQGGLEALDRLLSSATRKTRAVFAGHLLIKAVHSGSVDRIDFLLDRSKNVLPPPRHCVRATLLMVLLPGLLELDAIWELVKCELGDAYSTEVFLDDSYCLDTSSHGLSEPTCKRMLQHPRFIDAMEGLGPLLLQLAVRHSRHSAIDALLDLGVHSIACPRKYVLDWFKAGIAAANRHRRLLKQAFGEEVPEYPDSGLSVEHSLWVAVEDAQDATAAHKLLGSGKSIHWLRNHGYALEAALQIGNEDLFRLLKGKVPTHITRLLDESGF
jgi:hypothetical protein